MLRENAGIVMKCGRCLQQVPLGEMRYAKDGKTLVCQRCRGLSIQEHLDRLKRRPAAQPPRGGGTRYTCTSCGFAFSRTNIAPTRCPYCARPTVVEAQDVSGSRLLEE